MKNLSDMCEIIRYTGQAVEISREEVFRDLCCIQESAAYEIFEQEYEQLLDLVVSCSSLKPGKEDGNFGTMPCAG